MTRAVATATRGSAEARSRPVRTRKRLETRLILSALTLGLVLFTVELCCYAWEQWTAQGPLGWTLVAPRRLQFERHGDPARPYYLLTPNTDYNWTGIPVHINSHGFRTAEVQITKPAGTIRVLNIGDSYAFGTSVREEETYGKQLEGILNAREDGHRYEVINAATPGWNTLDERNFLLQDGLSYEPDVVILDISLVDDIYGATAVAANTQTPGLSNWLREHTFFWPMLSTQARMLLAGANGEQVRELNPPRTASAYFPLDEQDPHWDQWWSSVEDMQWALQQRGIRFAVAPFPTAFQYASNPHPPVPQRVIRTRAAGAGILDVDVLPTYQQACQAAPPNSCEALVNLLSADVWMHPTPLGHRLAAKALATSPLWP